MQVTDRKIFQNLLFEDYLNLPGYSHSDIRNKGNQVFATPKMQLGTLVHTYLLTPALYTGQNHELVIPIASKLKMEIGPLLAFLKPEISATANLVSGGWSMPVRGRADLGIIDRFGIDIKVSGMPLRQAVEYFGYNNQQNGYAAIFGFKGVIIISIDPSNKKISMYNVPITTAWWEEKIPKYGRPIKQAV